MSASNSSAPDSQSTTPATPSPAEWQLQTTVGLQSASSSDKPLTALTETTAGRNLLISEIARGGIGVVLRGRDPDLGRDLAVKVLREDLRDDPDMRRRFLEEAQVGGQLQHPGVVPVYDLGTFADGRPFFTMKLVQGQTLAALLEKRASPADDLPRFLAIFEDVCQTIAYAHSRGVLHRDLKPSNVMVGNFGEVQVVDWGLAKVLGGPGNEVVAGPARPPVGDSSIVQTVRSDSDADRSRAGTVFGTPAFMPPEQATGAIAGIDERADVFGLGAILCVILTGQPPYTSDTRESALEHAARGDLADAFARLDGCGADAELVQLCKDCLAADREARPRDGTAAAGRMTAYLAGVQERLHAAELERSAAKATAASAAARARAEWRADWLMASLIVAAIGLMAVGGWALQHQRSTEAERRQGVEAALTQLADLAGQRRWAESRAVLDQAADRLGVKGPPDLRRRVDQARADLDLVDRLEAVRLRAATLGDPNFHAQDADRAYDAAFRDFGLFHEGDRAETVAERLNRSPARGRLIDAIDDWAVVTRDQPRTVWLLAIARAADPDPDRDRIRDPQVWHDRDALLRLGPLPDPRLPPETLVVMGLLLDRANAEPIPFLKAAVRRYPNDFWLNVALGRILMEAQHWDDAVSYYRAASAIRPGAAVIFNNLGFVLDARGEAEEAVACYRRAVELNPGEAMFHYNLGTGLLGRGLLDDALAALSEAVRLNPAYASSRVNLGTVLHRKGRLEDAVAQFDAVLARDPHDPHALTNLGAVLVEQGRADEAVAKIRAALETHPDAAEVYGNLGNALRAQGHHDAALDCYRRALKLDPKSGRTESNLGAVLFEQGHAVEALPHAKKAVELDPRMPEAYYNLAVIQFGMGQVDAAIPSLHTAIELRPRYAMAYDALNTCLFARGRLEEALAAGRTCVALDPRRAVSYYNLGATLSALGHLAESMPVYRKSIELDPNFAPAHANLAGALYDDWQTEEAVRECQKAIALDDKYAVSHGTLGQALQRQGDFIKARAETKRFLDLLTPGHPYRAEAERQLVTIARLQKLGDKLPDLLGGDAIDADADECLTAAIYAQKDLRRYAAATRLYTEAFAQKPALAKDPVEAHRYDAACCAALIGTEELRRQALDWLRSDLAEWVKLADGKQQASRDLARERLHNWQTDADLAGVREPDELKKLPEAERDEWRRLWDEVGAAERKAAAKK